MSDDSRQYNRIELPEDSLIDQSDLYRLLEAAIPNRTAALFSLEMPWTEINCGRKDWFLCMYFAELWVDAQDRFIAAKAEIILQSHPFSKDVVAIESHSVPYVFARGLRPEDFKLITYLIEVGNYRKVVAK